MTLVKLEDCSSTFYIALRKVFLRDSHQSTINYVRIPQALNQPLDWVPAHQYRFQKKLVPGERSISVKLLAICAHSQYSR